MCTKRCLRSTYHYLNLRWVANLPIQKRSRLRRNLPHQVCPQMGRPFFPDKIRKWTWNFKHVFFLSYDIVQRFSLWNQSARVPIWKVFILRIIVNIEWNFDGLFKTHWLLSETHKIKARECQFEKCLFCILSLILSEMLNIEWNVDDSFYTCWLLKLIKRFLYSFSKYFFLKKVCTLHVILKNNHF